MNLNNEKAQSVHWDNPNKGLNKEKTSFKEKKKYVYLDKYNVTISEIDEDIVSLQKSIVRLWVAVVGLVGILLLTSI